MEGGREGKGKGKEGKKEKEGGRDGRKGGKGRKLWGENGEYKRGRKREIIHIEEI